MTMAYSRRVLLLVVGLAGACVGEQPATSPRSSTDAVIENTLPADGCSFPVTIDGVAYAPDEASLVAIRDRASAYGRVTVSVEYHLTGRMGRVECGFGARKDLPEISVVLR